MNFSRRNFLLRGTIAFVALTPVVKAIAATVRTVAPVSPADDFLDKTLRQVAEGMRVRYEQMAGRYVDAVYSSQRQMTFHIYAYQTAALEFAFAHLSKTLAQAVIQQDLFNKLRLNDSVYGKFNKGQHPWVDASRRVLNERSTLPIVHRHNVKSSSPKRLQVSQYRGR